MGRLQDEQQVRARAAVLVASSSTSPTRLRGPRARAVLGCQVGGLLVGLAEAAQVRQDDIRRMQRDDVAVVCPITRPPLQRHRSGAAAGPTVRRRNLDGGGPMRGARHHPPDAWSSQVPERELFGYANEAGEVGRRHPPAVGAQPIRAAEIELTGAL
jgi:hypothetical protein